MNRDEILEEINEERRRQSKWGESFDDKNTPNDWATYIVHYATRACMRELDYGKIKKDMIKVAALAIAVIETMERNEGKLAHRHYD